MTGISMSETITCTKSLMSHPVSSRPALEFFHPVPGGPSVGNHLHGKAGLFQQVAQHFTHQGGVVRHQRLVARIGPVRAQVVQTQAQLGVQVCHHFFQIQQEDDAVLQLNHADDRIVGHGSHIFVGRFHPLPADAVERLTPKP